jgi:hypothetical protein
MKSLIESQICPITRQQEKRFINELLKRDTIIIVEDFERNPKRIADFQDFVESKLHARRFYLFHPNCMVRRFKQYIKVVNLEAGFLSYIRKRERTASKLILKDTGGEQGLINLIIQHRFCQADCYGNPYSIYVSSTDYFLLDGKRTKAADAFVLMPREYLDPIARKYVTMPKVAKVFFNEIAKGLKEITEGN